MTGLSISGLLIFAAALFVAAFSPGPGIAAILARVLGRGRHGAVAFTAGMAIGDVVWLSFAVLGLAMLAQTFHEVFTVIKYAGAAYLLYIAYKMWTAPARPPALVADQRRESTLRLFLAGLAVTMGNPKTMIFYLALLPNIVDLTRVDGLAFAELAVVTLGVLALVFGFYIVLALRARQLITSPKAVRLVNRGSSAVMAGAAVAIATR
ncbi:LysE family translocator [Kaistia dalseonensis]|uniref:Threonine/homoserine/homoserine lactone efflux protein n=1 Tax=Kaistia dalseonensis TaxID=410840 RepID=A0ABU0H7W7_9HYPH|nr:LysE family translocator [Kaistia dalseonensis]MCX5494980.1 LysE family translocator [Kaistia dalseonensis]MDQ0437561.1 threonine/homoserine/homoserine lactone efflux protein [Kaistia dalseonensis]